MSGTISTTVTAGVTLGSGGYTSPLTIADTGAIIPAADGTNGLYAAAGTVFNNGSITGSPGASVAGTAQYGGIGVSLAGGTLFNSAIVTGGAGGGGNPGGGTGGFGVELSAGSLFSSGTIIGGIGAVDEGAGGIGGVGLEITGGSAANSGTVVGGAGGAAMNGETGATAGAGVFQKGGAFSNTGTLIGGVSDTALQPGRSGDGFVMDGGSADNFGLIEGGANTYGGIGAYLLGGGVLTNDGEIAGVSSTYVAGLAVRVIAGTLINDADGRITGGAGVGDGRGDDGVGISGNGTVNNSGVITGGGGLYGGDGMYLATGTLGNAGTITGGYGTHGGGGIVMTGGSVTNTGSIVGLGAGIAGAGVFMRLGDLTNAYGGTIRNAGSGIGLYVSSGAAENYGRIGSAEGVGALLTDGALVNAGTVTGGLGGGNGVDINGFNGQETFYEYGSLINAGTVLGGSASTSSTLALSGGTGVSLYRGGTLGNTGTIIGGAGYAAVGGDGIRISAASAINTGLIAGGGGATGGSGVYLQDGTFTNGGTVAAGGGGGDAVIFGNQVSTLAILPGAVFEGAVAANSAAGDELLLSADDTGSLAGTLDMGGSFSGFGTILFGATPWDLLGTAAELGRGEKIAGFAVPDEILAQDFSATSFAYIQGTGLELFAGTVTETLDLIGAFSTSSFLVTDTAAGTEIQLCYLAGTRILTPTGERAIETLAIGDAVITRYNGYRKIKWIGRQSFGRRFVENNRDQIPVRILAGALGPNAPRRDLLVSPGHSMLLGDVLVLARDLVNGVTVRQDECPEEVHYFQVEFETHDCVLAAGAWSESFCDYGGLRNQFHNVTDFHRLYPGHVTPRDHLLCAPRPEAGPALEAALRPVAARATALTRPGHLQGCIDTVSPRITGWAQDLSNPELPVLLEVFAGNRVLGTILACDFRADLAAAGIARGRCAFNFPAPLSARAILQVRRVADGATLPANPRRRRCG